MDWKVYLEKAKKNLRTAQLAYEHGDFNSCVSRAYFSVFHAEIASLVRLTEFRQDRWGHDRVQEEFNRRLIRSRKLFPSSLRFIHNDLIGRKHIADYKDQHVGLKTADRCLTHATEMLTAITSELVLHLRRFEG